jgi:hypothetical protein
MGAKPAIEGAQERHPGNNDAAVGLPPEDLLPAGRLRRELADDLLDDVLDGHEAQELAVFVDHEPKPLAVVLELGELGQERRSRGNEVRRAQQRPQLLRRDLGRPEHQADDCLERQDPDQVFERAFVHRQPGVVRRRELLAQERGLFREVERVDAIARRHHVVDGDRLEVHQVREHRLVLAAEILAAFEDERAQLFLRELASGIGCLLDAQDLEQPLDKQIYEPHDGRQAAEQRRQHVGNEGGNAVGVRGADHLGGDFREDQDEEGDHDRARGQCKLAFAQEPRRDDAG